MKPMIAAGLALGLSACASLAGRSNDVEVLKLLSDHASQCDRRYQGGLGLGGSFTFNIECKAQPTSRPPETAQDGG
jgi:hypothetical protein